MKLAARWQNATQVTLDRVNPAFHFSANGRNLRLSMNSYLTANLIREQPSRRRKMRLSTGSSRLQFQRPGISSPHIAKRPSAFILNRKFRPRIPSQWTESTVKYESMLNRRFRRPICADFALPIKAKLATWARNLIRDRVRARENRIERGAILHPCKQANLGGDGRICYSTQTDLRAGTCVLAGRLAHLSSNVCPAFLLCVKQSPQTQTNHQPATPLPQLPRNPFRAMP